MTRHYSRTHRPLRALRAGLLLTATSLATSALAGDNDHDHDHERAAGLDSHVHGVARLEIAQDGRQLVVGFTSPAMNIVGFEHAPRSDGDRERLQAAALMLQDPGSLLHISPEAGCNLTEAKVHAPHDDPHQQSATADADHDHEEGEEHSEFEANYTLQCEAASKLTRFTITARDKFPGIETLDVQWALDGGQGATRIDRDSQVIDVGH